MEKLMPLIGSCVLLFATAAAGDFDKIKSDLGRDGCHDFEFIAILESDIFDQVDSTYGTAYIASDGRYSLEIADESYVYDLESVYSYSESAGQVIVEKAGGSAPRGEEFSFIMFLEECYETYNTDKNNCYRLIKHSDASASYPDSLTVLIDSEHLQLKHFEYFDVNEELNRIELLKQQYRPECDCQRFVPDFPDSAEVIRL